MRKKLIITLKVGGKIEIDNPSQIAVDREARCLSIMVQEGSKVLRYLVPFENIAYTKDTEEQNLVQVPGGPVVNMGPQGGLV